VQLCSEDIQKKSTLLCCKRSPQDVGKK